MDVGPEMQKGKKSTQEVLTLYSRSSDTWPVAEARSANIKSNVSQAMLKEDAFMLGPSSR